MDKSEVNDSPSILLLMSSKKYRPNYALIYHQRNQIYAIHNEERLLLILDLREWRMVNSLVFYFYFLIGSFFDLS